MRPIVRRFTLVFLASVALSFATGARPAAGCVAERLSSTGTTATVLRAGRIAFVKTTCALVRVMSHEVLLRRSATHTPPTATR